MRLRRHTWMKTVNMAVSSKSKPRKSNLRYGPTSPPCVAPTTQ